MQCLVIPINLTMSPFVVVGLRRLQCSCWQSCESHYNARFTTECQNRDSKDTITNPPLFMRIRCSCIHSCLLSYTLDRHARPDMYNKRKTRNTCIPQCMYTHTLQRVLIYFIHFPERSNCRDPQGRRLPQCVSYNDKQVNV